MYHYEFNAKRKGEIYKITGLIFEEDSEKAKEIFNSILNYEIEFYKSLSDDCPAKCEVEILNKNIEKVNEDFKFTKHTMRNEILERKLNMTEEERKELKDIETNLI